MKLIQSSLVLSILLASSSLSALADDAVTTPKVDETQKREQVIEKREARQEKRIQKGVQKGTITAEEQQRLEAEQAKIKSMEADAMKDGKMDKKEFRKIRREQKQASRDIKRKKNNRRHEEKTDSKE